MAVIAFSVGCSRTVPHDFDARKASDYTAPEIATSRKTHGPEIVAVLLIPANTTVAQPAYPSTRYVPGGRERERFVGPARVFLSPGPRKYIVLVQGADGVFEFELDATLEPGKRYELRVVEDGERVTFELFELDASSYAAIYPKD